MDSFKQFITEWPWSRRQPEPTPEQQAQRRQQFQTQEDGDYQQEVMRFKKGVEDFARDPSSTQSQLMRRLTHKWNDRDPLYIAVHYKLPEVDYLKVNDPQLKKQYDAEVAEIVQHAVQWFDAAKEGVDQKPANFDWQHTKDLAVRRANYASKKTDAPKILKGPWAGVKQDDPMALPPTKGRKPAKEN